jgi:uncharacterized membrane protein
MSYDTTLNIVGFSPIRATYTTNTCFCNLIQQVTQYLTAATQNKSIFINLILYLLSIISFLLFLCVGFCVCKSSLEWIDALENRK